MKGVGGLQDRKWRKSGHATVLRATHKAFHHPPGPQERRAQRRALSRFSPKGGGNKTVSEQALVFMVPPTLPKSATATNHHHQWLGE